jgi:hypothetical protein
MAEFGHRTGPGGVQGLLTGPRTSYIATSTAVVVVLGPGTAMHDVHTMKLGRRAPPWWGLGAVRAPPGHRCDRTGLPVRP